MSQPAVNIQEVDGGIGNVSNGLAPMVIIGVANDGPIDTPTSFARVTDVEATFVDGPLVQAACVQIETKGHPVILVRTGQTVTGTYQDVTGGGNDEVLTSASPGTSVATTDTGVEPLGNFQIRLRWLTGGTIGVDGITYRYSVDGGRTESGTIALGIATSVVLPAFTGGITIDYAAGTILAGRTDYIETRAPEPNTSEIGTAWDAVKNYAGATEQVHCAYPISSTTFDTTKTKAEAMRTAGKPINWFGNFRLPNYGESEATYLAAFQTALGAKEDTDGCVCAGSAEIVSGTAQTRIYVQPVVVTVAAEHSNVLQHINVADPNRASLPGVTITDGNGNPLYHNETTSPGLDDARACVLRTWNEPQGVFVNRPRLFSADGSDFFIVPHRRVMNLAYKTLVGYFVRRLNRPVRVNKTTGYILESEALEIETGADALMRAVLMAEPMASGGGFSKGRFVQISRTDNLLSTKTMTGQARIVPLAYPEFANISLGFYNPALRIAA